MIYNFFSYYLLDLLQFVMICTKPPFSFYKSPKKGRQKKENGSIKKLLWSGCVFQKIYFVSFFSKMLNCFRPGSSFLSSYCSQHSSRMYKAFRLVVLLSIFSPHTVYSTAPGCTQLSGWLYYYLYSPHTVYSTAPGCTQLSGWLYYNLYFVIFK